MITRVLFFSITLMLPVFLSQVKAGKRIAKFENEEEKIMYSSVDVIWTLLGAAMVFFMQAGFALCEAGMTRAKNTGNILMKKTLWISVLELTLLLAVRLRHHVRGTGALIGGFFLIRSSAAPTISEPFHHVLRDFSDSVLCNHPATIVSGSMAERTNFKAYCAYSALISPRGISISGHWIWGGGWLSALGFP